MSDTENTEIQQVDELTLLKQRAATLGISFSNNIGAETLKERINEKLNGTVNYKFIVSDGQNNVTCQIAVDAGTISAVIKDNKGNECYKTSTISADQSFSFDIEETGSHTIILDADAYSGNIIVSWDESTEENT